MTILESGARQPQEKEPESTYARLAEQADAESSQLMRNIIESSGHILEVARDMDTVAKRKLENANRDIAEGVTQEERDFSRAFEYATAQKAQEYLGEEYRTGMASVVDDLLRNIDVVIEQRGVETRIGIDVTTALKLQKKILQIKNAMFENPRPEELKYAPVLLGDKEQKRTEPFSTPVIKVLSGLQRPSAEVIVNRFDKGEADKSPMPKMIFLYQLKMQLEHYILYMQKWKPNRRDDLLTACVAQLESVKKIWDDEVRALKERYASEKVNPYTEENIIKQINPANDASLYTNKSGEVVTVLQKVFAGDLFTQKLRAALDEYLPLENKAPVTH